MEKEVNRELSSTVQPPVGLKPEGEEAPVNGRSSGIRNASKEEFEKVTRKVFAVHDGLFRRLAEHDRQR
jgi:hypothetical protein